MAQEVATGTEHGSAERTGRATEQLRRPPGRPTRLPMPAGPDDWGLFGPDSVSWRVHSSPVLLVGGLRALIIQSLNPLAMAGISQHSDYLKRPLSRLRRTSEFVATTVFGDTASVVRAAEMVSRVHSRVRGVDPITGWTYSADDLQTRLWVHCVEVHSFLAAYRTYGGGLDDLEQDAYLAEQVAAAEQMGIPAELVPSSRAGYRQFFEMMRPALCVSEASRDAIELVVNPPLTRELLPYQLTLRMMASAAVAITPRYMRRMAGIERSRLIYLGAGAATRATGIAMRAPGLNRLGGGLVGKRTINLPRRAKAAAHSTQR